MAFQFDDAEEVELVYFDKQTRSYYRDIVLRILKYFEDNPNKKIVKKTYEMAADADRICKTCRKWTKASEGLKIVLRSNVVYFLKV